MSDDTSWWGEIDTSRTAVFLDVDGTLLGFKERPEDVVADASLLALLERLREAAGGAVALVSGRMISDLDRIVAPLILPAGGVHGAELRFADGRRAAAAGAAIAEVRAFLDATVTGDTLAIQHGKMVAEVKAAGCHKGVAIAALLGTPPFVGRAPLFMGDDLTDEYGFQMVNGVPGGVSVKIGGADETTSARRRLPDTSAVRDFLASIVEPTKGQLSL